MIFRLKAPWAKVKYSSPIELIVYASLIPLIQVQYIIGKDIFVI